MPKIAVRRRFQPVLALLTLGVALAIGLAGWSTPAHAVPYVYVTNEFGGSISQYEIGAAEALRPLGPGTVGGLTSPRGIAVGPDGRVVYVVDAGLLGGAGTLVQYRVGPGGALSTMSTAPLPQGRVVNGVAVSRDGRSVYVTSVTDGVLQFDAGSDRPLRAKTPAAAVAPGARAVAVSPDGRSLYAAGNSLAVFQFNVENDGRLTRKGSGNVPAPDGAAAMAVHPDGRSLYVVYDRGDLPPLRFPLDAGGAGGQPREIEGIIGERAIAVSRDGRSLYMTPNESPATIAPYDIGPDGSPSAKRPRRVAAAGALGTALALSPSGRSLYATGTGIPPSSAAGSVSQFDVDSGGLLSPKSSPTVAAGVGPVGIAVTPVVATSGRDVLTGSAGDERICGLGGADLVRGLGGDDALFGDRCGARVSAAAAAAGGDRLLGGRGDDDLFGGPGRDRLSGGPGRDRLAGGPGPDTLTAGAQRDVVDARGGGRDLVICGSGRDTVRADDRDRLRGCELVR
jgi:hypothetical protein